MIFDATDKDQIDLSLALSCIQEQMWVQNIITGMLQQRYGNHIPMQVSKLIWEIATPMEKKQSDWWKLVHFQYDYQHTCITAYVLTIIPTTMLKVYPFSIGRDLG